MNGTFVVCSENLTKVEPYVHALKTAGVPGGNIHTVTPADSSDDLRRVAHDAAGLVVCGGPDIEPRRYGEIPRPDAGLKTVPELDVIELELLAGAEAGRTPVWGICRGMQMINVYRGGSLYQDIQLQLPGVVDHYITEPADKLAHHLEGIQTKYEIGALLARDRALVNTRHHQGVKIMGRGLVPVAYSPDGVLEVMHLDSDEWWVRAVQWHPENLVALPLQRALWAAFVAAAKASVNGNGFHPQRAAG